MSRDDELLTNTCRLCLKQDETVCNDLEGVLEIVRAIAQIDIPLEKGLPAQVCSDCVQRLEIANDMRDVCLRSLEYFNKIEDGKINFDEMETEQVESLEDNQYEITVFDCPRCCICGCVFDQYSLLDLHCRKEHDRALIMSSDIFWCSVCSSNEFKSNDELQSHRTCIKCFAACIDSDELTIHNTLEHSEQVIKEEEEQQEESEYDEETEEYLIEPNDTESSRSIVRSTKLQGCCRCAEQFKRADDLLRHFETRHAEDNIYKGERGKYNCKWCKTPFDHKGDLQRHYKSPRLKTYSCNECNTFFVTFTKLRSHMEQEHGGFQIFKCDECDKTYEQLNSLRYHKYTMHNEKNRYK